MANSIFLIILAMALCLWLVIYFVFKYAKATIQREINILEAKIKEYEGSGTEELANYIILANKVRLFELREKLKGWSI